MASIKKSNDNNVLGWYKVKGDYTLAELLSQGLPDEENVFEIEAPVLSITNSTGSTVVLSWTDNDAAESWTVQRSTDGVTYSNLQTGLQSPIYTDTTVSSGNTYYYRVQGFTVGIGKASRYSNVSSIYLPGFISDFDGSGQIGANVLRGLCFSADGQKMYLGDQNGSKIFEYSFYVAGDLSNAFYSGNSATLGSSGFVVDLFITDNGTQLRQLGGFNNVNQVANYNLLTDYDIRSITLFNQITPPFISGTRYSLTYSNGGSNVYYLTSEGLYWMSSFGYYGNGVSPLLAQLDIDSIVGESSGGVRGIAISDDGQYFYVATQNNLTLVTLKLSTPYDITTYSIYNVQDISSEVTTPISLAYYDSVIYVADQNNSKINAYSTVIITQ